VVRTQCRRVATKNGMADITAQDRTLQDVKKCYSDSG
jgi:hypothetical protein